MNPLKKMLFLKISLVIWLVFSMAYIGLDIWNSYSYKLYSRGYEDAINEIIERQEIKECKPLAIHNTKKTFNLIDISCLGSTDAGSGNAR